MYGRFKPHTVNGILLDVKHIYNNLHKIPNNLAAFSISVDIFSIPVAFLNLAFLIVIQTSLYVRPLLSSSFT